MKIKLFKDSMRFKLVLIYCLLVFIATTTIGVMIMSQLENYHLDSAKQNIIKTVKEGLLTSLSVYPNLAENKQDVESNIEAWSKTIQAEIFVVDSNFSIIASNNASVNENAIDALEARTIYTATINKEDTISYTKVRNDAEDIPVMNVAVPIIYKGKLTGIIYVRQDLSLVEATINESKQIFLKAMLVGLLIAIVLGIFISSSITVPINEFTKTAKKMADGDFSGKLEVKSSDEIGRLAQMFNLLSSKLETTLLEIGNEKRKLETIIQNMADGLIAVNLEGAIIHANQTAKRLLKVTDIDLTDESYDALIGQFSENLMMEELLTKCKDGEFAESFTKDDIIYSVRYEKFKDENENDIGIIILLQDITQRQKLENMQMDFVANVSHELKTPLTTIKSYTETMLEGFVDDKETQREFLEIVNSEADRMTRLVKDLLQLSRLDNDQEILNKRDGNLVSLLNAVVRNTSFMASEKNQQLNCLFEANDKIYISMDKDRIEQVMVNLLSNAIKYTQEGGRIDLDALKSDGEAVVIVKDNGYGIPQSMQTRVFERFFRVDKARSRAMGGTGLGLAITKQIVEGHGGSIELRSVEKQGTVVTIRLPLSFRRGMSNIE